MISKPQAKEIIYAHEIDVLFLSHEELELLKAYKNLMKIAEIGINPCGE